MRVWLLTTLLLSAPLVAAQTTPAALSASEQATVGLIERSLPGVLFIETSSPRTGGVFSSPLFETPRSGPQSSGSGFFVTSEGHALTNYHVIEGASQITVRLHGQEQTFPARVVGTAPDYDLALIQVQGVPRNLIRPLPLGDSDGIRAGQVAVALGAPFGLQFSASTGIVSAVERTIPTGVRQIAQNAIQTDAAINPGNSGGPLLNSAGQVIGINTMILSPAGAATGVGQNAGVGFAIPVNVAKRLLSRLQAGETIVGPVLGVTLLPLELSAFREEVRQRFNLPREGALIAEVVPGSPAAQAGLRGGTTAVNTNTPLGVIRLGGDVITAVDGRRVTSSADLRETLFARQAGDVVRLTVRRGNETVTVPVTLARGTPPPAQR